MEITLCLLIMMIDWGVACNGYWFFFNHERVKILINIINKE